MEITTDRLFAEIGVLHLELSIVKQQLAEKEAIITNQVEALMRQAEIIKELRGEEKPEETAPEVIDINAKRK